MASVEAAAVIKMLRERPMAQGNPTVEDMRKGMEASFSLFTIPDDVKSEPVTANGIPCEWITTPGADSGRAVLYLHGGGYVVGSVASHRELCGRISRAAGARVLSVDYRLAPEHPCPAAVDDAVAAYEWLLGHVPAAGIAIGGDSAGGGLTAATLVAIRDRGLELPAAGVLLSPWLDLAITGESIKTRASLDPMIGGSEGINGMAAWYLGGQDPRTPLASPLYADLKGLPPLLIQVGTSEVLFDDSTRFDAAARSAGVDVTFEAWNEMVHVFQAFAEILPEGQEAIEHLGAFIKARTKTLAPA